MPRDVVEEWARVTAARHGFADVAMVADLRGLCAACGHCPRNENENDSNFC